MVLPAAAALLLLLVMVRLLQDAEAVSANQLPITFAAILPSPCVPNPSQVLAGDAAGAICRWLRCFYCW